MSDPAQRQIQPLMSQLNNKEHGTRGASTEQKRVFEDRRPREVSFTDVTIREYKLTIGDHPCCKYGPPTSLSWDYEEVHKSSINDYEAGRGPRRKYLCLSYIRRREILINGAGFTEKDLRAAIRQKDYCNFQRQVSRTISSLWRVEDSLQSLSRKTSRAAKSIKRKIRKAIVMPSLCDEASKQRDNHHTFR